MDQEDQMNDVNAETDALLERLAARRQIEKSASGLIYKRHDSPPLQEEAATDANAWLQEHLERFADVLGAEMGRADKQLRDEIVSRLDELQSRLDDLESRVSDLEGNGADRTVVPLRGGHAA
jgi:hypothetical protein